MITITKALKGSAKSSRIFASKVDNRQYLTNKREPAETISDITPGDIDSQSGIIKHATPGRQAFRRLALTLRFGYKI